MRFLRFKFSRKVDTHTNTHQLWNGDKVTNPDKNKKRLVRGVTHTAFSPSKAVPRDRGN